MKFSPVIPIVLIAEIFTTHVARGSICWSFGFLHCDRSPFRMRIAVTMCAVTFAGSAVGGETEIDGTQVSVVEVVQTTSMTGVPHPTPDHSVTQCPAGEMHPLVPQSSLCFDESSSAAECPPECPPEQISPDGSMDSGSPLNMLEMHDGSQLPGFLMSEGQALGMSVSPVFVHDVKTLPPSKRIAEIWVQLPENTESKVSVNFVEYPPEGTFRIFRTKISTNEPRQFYLSAKRWDVQANRWIPLVAALSNDGTPDVGFIYLRPGERTVVKFDNPPVPGVTSRFQFDPEVEAIEGKATYNDHSVSSVFWPSHPKIVNISMTPSPQRLSALPVRPFFAQITFTIQDAAKQTVATLKPIRVRFTDAAGRIEGPINCDLTLKQSLDDALVGVAVRPGTYKLKATMQFEKDLGDLGRMTVSGEIGNSIELHINP